MNGPFLSEEGGTMIAKFTKDELFPITKRIRTLAIEISNFRAGFRESFLRLKIKHFENSYKDVSVVLVSLYHTWSTPDELFKELKIDTNNPQLFGPIIQDYFNSQQAVMQHFNEGFRLLSYIDGILTNQSTASYNRISIGLSLLAIATSIVLAVLRFAS